MSSEVTVMQMFVPLQSIKSCVLSINMTENDGWGKERKASIYLVETFSCWAIMKRSVGEAPSVIASLSYSTRGIGEVPRAVQEALSKLRND